MSLTGAWSDLMPRVTTAVVISTVAFGALIFGGYVFAVLLFFAVAVMHWELGGMLTPFSKQSGYFSGSFAAFFFALALFSESSIWSMVILTVGAFTQLLFFHKRKKLGLVVSLAIFFGALNLFWLRDTSGFFILFWLVLVVIMTDVGGYFGGRILKGPKLIPTYSPQKTWSGVLVGWAFAIVATILTWNLFLPNLALHSALLLTILLSVASQGGDICESALKRSCGVKDSSSLLPGHGGFMDRFDSLLGASLTLGVVQPVLAGS